MKVIKYNVKVKLETKDPKKELNKVGGILIGRFTKDEKKFKDQLNSILQGKSKVIELDGIKASLSDSSIEVEGIKFRKLINVRKFINEIAEKYEAKCGQLNKSENLMTKQCEGENVKVYFEIKPEKIKPQKKEESKKEEEQQKNKTESKS
ncbi:hypothetical protein SJAV_21030 [Sulfurisphaera javensis]|uniref:Uncharacterized protein n=1 Tax=Sulfurisphaera javensis TaxID=2049879 RepID=A0AAT9GTB2_9CREN